MKSGTSYTLVTRISLIVAILAGLAAGGLNISRVRQKIAALQSDLASQTAARQKAETELAKTASALTTTTSRLNQTTASLEAATADKQKAVATAAAQTERAGKLAGELAGTQKVRDEAQVGLARYRAAGMEPDQVLRAGKRIKELQSALSAAEVKIKERDDKMQRLARLDSDAARAVPLPAGLRAKVIASDAKWHFVVLDAGAKQGMLERGELLLSRDGKLVAKARVIRVQNDRSIADLLPGWELVEVMEGDSVIPADPQS